MNEIFHRRERMENFMWSIGLWFYEVLILWFYDFMYGFYVFSFSQCFEVDVTHSRLSYLHKHIDKVEKALKRMRWKLLFFDRDQVNWNTNVNKNVQHQHIIMFNLKNKKFPTTSSGCKRISERHTNYDPIHQI